MRTTNFGPNLGALSVFLIVSLVLCSLNLIAQEETPKTTRETFVKEMVGLLKVGFPDDKILAHWDKVGWPKSIKDIDFVVIRNANASGKILKKLKSLRESHAIFSNLADNYEPFEIPLEGGFELSLLRPKRWHETKSKGIDRFVFHEHGADLPGWFRRTSVFVWVFDSGAWKKNNQKALTRIVLSAAKKRLIRGGLQVGALKESSLFVKRGQREFPIIEALCRDPKDKLKGVIAMSAYIDEASGKIAVLGYSTRLSKADSPATNPKSILSQMLGTLRITSK